MSASSSNSSQTRYTGVPLAGIILLILGSILVEAVAEAQHVTGAPGDQARIMKVGEWVGQYTDINGYKGQLRFTISETGREIRGEFQLMLATEDEAERYRGALTGDAGGDQIVLKLRLQSGETMICNLKLRHPAAYAEQAIFGLVQPVPSLTFGGGTLMAWRFRNN